MKVFLFNSSNLVERRYSSMTTNDKWPDYEPAEIEARWQILWEQRGLYLARQDYNQPKYYCLDFFPYPSGEGLHVGHCRNYVPTDVYSRYKRMRGYKVLHPFGWDAFGEPTEQFAVTHGVHPQITTRQNTANSRRQLEMIGTSYDWSREIWSSAPEYYRWTQWFFLLLYRRGLAYRDRNWQWWCPTCQTTLSSHEAVGGVCWRGHSGVTRREIPAWYFRITAYADRLLEDLDRIDWPDSIKAMQRNWIGRSEGAQITFPLLASARFDDVDQDGIVTFTTRPDTLFGVTFIALAPENPLAMSITLPERRDEVVAYCENASKRSEIERMDEAAPKTGVGTGRAVRHPLSGEPIPVWVSDYVLLGYGTGAIMGVPAHDERDFAFAKACQIPIRVVVAPPTWKGEALLQAYTGDGVLVDSQEFTGLNSQMGAEKIVDQLERKGIGKRMIQYRMRDWLISRQRYWGTPIPIIYCDSCGEVPVPEDQLPVLLPDMMDFQPDGSGRSPLARVQNFVNTICPQCGGTAQRETDTMGGFACSSWYFLRFANPHYHEGPFDPEAVKYWLPVDLYIGGAEHAVLHLLYSRFWIKVMFDAGLVAFDEPFSSLINQGQLMGEDGIKMSKSRPNVVTPDQIVKEFGADALRLHVMFIAPFDQDANWTLEGIHGSHRFLHRLWSIFKNTYFHQKQAVRLDPELERMLHRMIQGITERLDQFRLNTAIAMFMEFLNTLYERYTEGKWRTKTFYDSLDILLKLLAPFVPHIAEELWMLTGHQGSVHECAWPEWDPELVANAQVNVAVQVNGKLRDVLGVEPNLLQDELVTLAKASDKVAAALEGKHIQNIIYVPGKIINFVV
jgi:leucyl-tRNA synthetase